MIDEASSWHLWVNPIWMERLRDSSESFWGSGCGDAENILTLYKNSKHSHLAWAILSKVSGTGSVLPELEGNLNTSMTIFSGCQGVFSSISNKVHSQSLDSSSNRELITSWRNLVCFFFFFWLSPQQICIPSECFLTKVTTCYIYTRGQVLSYNNKHTIISFNFQKSPEDTNTNLEATAGTVYSALAHLPGLLLGRSLHNTAVMTPGNAGSPVQKMPSKVSSSSLVVPEGSLFSPSLNEALWMSGGALRFAGGS